MEVAGLDHEEANIERARSFCAPGGKRDPGRCRRTWTRGRLESIARERRWTNATIRHLPGAANAMAAVGPARAGHTGTWRRHGRHIVVHGL